MKPGRVSAALIGFGLTGQFVYPLLRQKFDDVLVVEPHPVSGFSSDDSEKKSLPFDPDSEGASRSQRFGRWVYPGVDLAFFEARGLSFAHAAQPAAFAGLAGDPLLLPRARMSVFPWQIGLDVVREKALFLCRNGDGVRIETNAGTYDAERVILTTAPQTVWKLLQTFDPALVRGTAQADEHAVRSLLVFSQRPPQTAAQSAFYGPIDLDEGSGCGVECLGPFAWDNLTPQSRESLAQQGLKGKSYRMLHFFLSGPFVQFIDGKRVWDFHFKNKQGFDDFFQNFLKRVGDAGDEAILLRDFSDDPGLFHQSALRGVEKIFDENGFVSGCRQIQVLGSSLLPRLSGVHPTLEILKTSHNALL